MFDTIFLLFVTAFTIYLLRKNYENSHSSKINYLMPELGHEDTNQKVPIFKRNTLQPEIYVISMIDNKLLTKFNNIVHIMGTADVQIELILGYSNQTDLESLETYEQYVENQFSNLHIDFAPFTLKNQLIDYVNQNSKTNGLPMYFLDAENLSSNSTRIFDILNEI